MLNFFKILDFKDNDFFITDNQILNNYFNLQKKYHPDNYDGPISDSIAINIAYNNLKHPLLRAKHIFELNYISIAIDLNEIIDLFNDPQNNFNIYYKNMENAFLSKNLHDAYKHWCVCQYLKKAIKHE